MSLGRDSTKLGRDWSGIGSKSERVWGEFVTKSGRNRDVIWSESGRDWVRIGAGLGSSWSS